MDDSSFLHEKEVKQNLQYYYKIAYKDKDESYNRENTLTQIAFIVLSWDKQYLFIYGFF